MSQQRLTPTTVGILPPAARLIGHHKVQNAVHVSSVQCIPTGAQHGHSLMHLPACSLLQWQPGDFLISDNLALGHEADPDTQLPRIQVGRCERCAV